MKRYLLVRTGASQYTQHITSLGMVQQTLQPPAQGSKTSISYAAHAQICSPVLQPHPSPLCPAGASACRPCARVARLLWRLIVLNLETTIYTIQQRINPGMQQVRAGTCHCKAQAPLHVELKNVSRLKYRRAELPAPHNRRTFNGKVLVEGIPRRNDEDQRIQDPLSQF